VKALTDYRIVCARYSLLHLLSIWQQHDRSGVQRKLVFEKVIGADRKQLIFNS
jgi:hypothetical protein